MKKGIKGYFITGLLIVLPLYITFYIFELLVNFMDSILRWLPEFLRPEKYLKFHIPGLGVLITIAMIFIVGFLATNIFGKKLIAFAEGILDKIPFARVVYKSTKQFLETFFSEKHEGFRKVVLVEFPRNGMYSVGFVTAKARGELGEKGGPDSVCVFVPTTPNPTTGFHFTIPEKDTIALDMTVEDAFKIIMTAGVVHPEKAAGKTNETA